MKISSPHISLSCRLKSGASLKAAGQASPMFPPGGKKRGSGLENPEPSSPKVTCIGQVRVKTRKQGKKMMMMKGGSVKQRRSNLARQSSNGGGGGGNGFQSAQRNQRWVHLPFTICDALRAFGSELSCFLPCNSPCSSSKEEPKPAGRSPERSCGRWLVAVDEIEENGRQRRHVFEGMDFKGGNEEESRISICVPPKNALLLMRCRSDPVKMEELNKRFCESPATNLEEEEEEQEESKSEQNVKLKTQEELSEDSVSDAIEENPIEMGTENGIDVQKLGIPFPVVNHQCQIEQEENRVQPEELTEEAMAIPIPIQTRFESEMAEDTEKLKSVEEDEFKAAHGNGEDPKTEENEKQRKEAEEDENGENPTSAEAAVLPECLLLMMYEPKLSMEVSKETWVCSTDFTRCVPTREKKAPPPPPPKKKKKPASNIAVQPGRWSCSLPAAAMIEQGLARGKGGFEPLALTRCKSEPMRSAAANLAPDAAGLGF